MTDDEPDGPEMNMLHQAAVDHPFGATFSERTSPEFTGVN